MNPFPGWNNASEPVYWTFLINILVTCCFKSSTTSSPIRIICDSWFTVDCAPISTYLQYNSFMRSHRLRRKNCRSFACAQLCCARLLTLRHCLRYLWFHTCAVLVKVSQSRNSKRQINVRHPFFSVLFFCWNIVFWAPPSALSVCIISANSGS